MADDLDKENLETFEFGDDDGFNDFNNQQSVGSAIQNNTALKIGIIAAAVVFIIGGFLLFGGKSESEALKNSSVGTGGAAIKEAPTTNEVTDSYKEAIDEFNEAGEEEATQTGESFIPVPTGPATNTGIIVPEEEEIQEDPLERWRLLQEQRAQQQREQMSIAQDQSTDPDELSAEEQRRQEAVGTLAQSMVQSMQELTQKSDQTIKMEVQNVIGDDKEYYKELAEEDHRDEIERLDRRQELIEKRQELAEIDPSQQEEDGVELAEILVNAGTIEYAQMLIQANSDIPGPVLAQVVSGPLAGSRIIGSFSVVDDQYLVITFSSVILDGQTLSVNAVAVDPETNLTGVVTEVDNRYFKRLILPVAAEFISGLSSAIAETQNDVFVTGDVIIGQQNDLDTDEIVAQAIEGAGEEISSFVDQEASRTRVMVRVAAGTPIGILFTEPVLLCPEEYTCGNNN